MGEKTRKPGWYVDEVDRRYQRYWDGASWGEPMAIPPKPQGLTVGKIALGVALGIAGVLGALVLFNGITQGSRDLDCSTQELEVELGDRAYVDRDCR